MMTCVLKWRKGYGQMEQAGWQTQMQQPTEKSRRLIVQE